MNNKLRTQCAGAAVYAHARFIIDPDNPPDLNDINPKVDLCSDVLRENLCDLLCDLRHWAAAKGLDYDECNSTGLMHYNAETLLESLQKP